MRIFYLIALLLMASALIASAKDFVDYQHGPGSWQLTNTQVIITSGNPKITGSSASGSCAGGGSSELTWTNPPASANDRQQIIIDFTGSSTHPEPAPSDADNAEQIARMKCGVKTYGTGIGINFNATSCVSFYDASATTIAPHKWNVDSPESYRHYTFAFPTLAKVYICSRPSQNNLDLSEENIDKFSRRANELWFNMLVMVETAGGDGLIIYTYTWVPGDAKETVHVHGSVSNADDEPLPYSRIVIKINGKEHETVADKDGDYSIKVPKPASAADSWAYVSLNYKRDGKNYFNVYYNAGQNSYREMWAGNQIDLSKDDVTANIKLKLGSFERSTFTAPGQRDTWIVDSGAGYYHMHEAVDFALTKLKANIDDNLPVNLWLGNTDGNTHYRQGVTEIHVGNARVGRANPDQPWIIYHEFSHHIMYSAYGSNLKGKELADSRNHGGFMNPNSADSWSEGFAAFMAMVIAENNGNMQPYIYGTLANNEDNYKVWQNRGKREEFAIAGVLWDLYDKTNDKGDTLSLMLPDLWDVMKVKREDAFEVYTSLKAAFPRTAERIDKVFIEHGVFADTTVGNAKRDSFEPFKDSNGNGRYDGGEAFLDYGCQQNESEIKYKQGFAIGKAANYQRLTRQYGGRIPDSYISVPDTQVWLYNVKVDYADGADYEYTSYAQGGLIYVYPVPYNATITVTPLSKDFSSSKPFVITSDELDARLLSSEGKGSFASHSFELKATGSKLDPPMPAGLDKPYTEDDDKAVFPEPKLLKTALGQAAGGSSSPVGLIFILVVAVVAGAAILIVRKKK